MNPYFLLGAVIAFAAAVGGAYIQGRSDGRDKCVAESVRDERVTQIASAAAADAAASAISAIKVRNTTINQEVQREIVETVRYRECVHPDGVMRNINEALTGSPGPAASGVLPTADTAERPDVR